MKEYPVCYESFIIGFVAELGENDFCIKANTDISVYSGKWPDRISAENYLIELYLEKKWNVNLT